MARASGTVDAGLDKVADKLVSAAIEGDAVARTEIGNRIDGKPSEHVHIEQDIHVNVGDSASITGRLGARKRTPQPTVQ